MKCPICNDVELKIAERQGVEIDYCPQCRGVWLDRGELDKIIERSNPSSNAPHYREQHSHAPEERTSHGYREHDDHDRHDYHGYNGDKHHKRKSLLKELFDF